MTSGFFYGKLWRGLAFRVLFFLSLALLPIGLIAISQTQQISEQNRLNAELSLIAITEQAASAEAQILRDAFGAADALSSILRLHRDDVAECAEFFRAYQKANPSFSLVGFIPRDGYMECSSSAKPYDFADDPDLETALADPRRRTQTIPRGSISGQPVTVVTTPVYEEDDLLGFIAISIPFSTFQDVTEPELPFDPLALMTFNRDGQVITSETGLDAGTGELPADIALRVFTDRDSAVFEAKNEAGEPRVYAIQPVVPDALFAVSVWPGNTPFLNPSIFTRLGTLVPILMWAASLVVAFWALNRLAIRHIRKLVRQMRRFALNRNLPRETLGAAVPTELVEMETAFVGMAESILRDEAVLEDSLREKNILLKEVHHRVKNNLQLISSIMNMQIRQAKSDDSVLVLRRLQDRILSLATVHKNLYKDDNLVRVDAAVLLTEVVDQLLSVGLSSSSNVTVTRDFSDISLDADDAAPLTLLVSEALTNALKHVPRDREGAGRIEMRLERAPNHHAVFTIRNDKCDRPDENGTRLGKTLIEAFTRQLNGQVEIEETEDSYSLGIYFPVPQEAKAIYDY